MLKGAQAEIAERESERRDSDAQTRIAELEDELKDAGKEIESLEDKLSEIKSLVA